MKIWPVPGTHRYQKNLPGTHRAEIFSVPGIPGSIQNFQISMSTADPWFQPSSLVFVISRNFSTEFLMSESYYSQSLRIIYKPRSFVSRELKQGVPRYLKVNNF